MTVPDIIIAVDGYSSTGKSSLAKQIARSLGFTYLDSGALYRGVTLFAQREGHSSPDNAVSDSLHELAGNSHLLRNDTASLAIVNRVVNIVRQHSLFNIAAYPDAYRIIVPR